MVSQQSEANQQLLGLFRFWLAIGIVLLLMWGLVSQYRQQREDAQRASFLALAGLFTERAALIHGLWLSQNRPAMIHEVGRVFSLAPDNASAAAASLHARYVMSAGGWPQGSAQDQEPGQACRQLWLQLLSVPLMLDGEPVTVLPLVTSPGCEYRMGEAGFVYRFADGSVTPRGS